MFGFLGPNGAGKTTTVRTLGTLIAPNSGSAIVAGVPLNPKNGPAIRSRISMMPESPGLYLRLTVTENLQCFAGLYELGDIRGRIDRALRAVNLEDRARDLCGSLSKGLRQRVALAGLAGGSYASGSDGARLDTDATDWAWTISGRARDSGLLASPLPL